MYTTRRVKRVPDTEQRRGGLVKNCQACRTTSGTTPQESSRSTAGRDTSDEASERRSAKAQDLIPLVEPHVLKFLAQRRRTTQPSTAIGAQGYGPRERLGGTRRRRTSAGTQTGCPDAGTASAARDQQTCLNSHPAA